MNCPAALALSAPAIRPRLVADPKKAAKTFEGRPCRHGHGRTRYAKGRACVECMKARLARYQASPKGKAARHRYQASPKGKAARHRYRASPKGKARMARFNRSPAGKAMKARYDASPAGKAIKARYNASPACKMRAIIRRSAKLSAPLLGDGPLTDRRLARLEREMPTCAFHLTPGRCGKLTLEHLLPIRAGFLHGRPVPGFPRGGDGQRNLSRTCLPANISHGSSFLPPAIYTGPEQERYVATIEKLLEILLAPDRAEKVRRDSRRAGHLTEAEVEKKIATATAWARRVKGTR